MLLKMLRLLPEQFTSQLLVVACVAGGSLVCFSFVVEIQRRESSEVKDVGGGKRIF